MSSHQNKICFDKSHLPHEFYRKHSNSLPGESSCLWISIRNPLLYTVREYADMLLHGVSGPCVDQLVEHLTQHFSNLSVFTIKFSKEDGDQLVVVSVLYNETNCNNTRGCHDLQVFKVQLVYSTQYLHPIFQKM